MRIIRSSLIIAVVLILAIAGCGTFAYCIGLAGVEIEGEYVVEGGPDKAEKADFLLEGIGGPPMPEDSEGGSKKVSALPGEKFSFGEICYLRPGVYEYTVRRVTLEDRNDFKDRSVFKVTVNVFSDGSWSMIYEREGDDGKSDSIVFTDLYENTEGNIKSVKTGDSTNYDAYMALIIAALICLIKCRFLLSDE